MIQKKVENAIIFFAEKYKCKEKFESLLIDIKSDAPVVEKIVYEMFLNEFNILHSNINEFKNYYILLDYAKEINKR